MSKPPTVSELVVGSNVTFKSVTGSPPQSPMAMDEGIRPDFDTDVLWKPPRLQRKERTVSMDSNDSEMTRKASFAEGDINVTREPRQRRVSLTEMIFGTSPSGGLWGPPSGAGPTQHPTGLERERKTSVTDDFRFKDIMKQQSSVLNRLGDDGLGSSFKKRDYYKN